MMSGVVRSREAERLAKCRREFAYATKHGVSVREARARLSRAELELRQQAFERRWPQTAGTVSDDAQGERPLRWMMAE